MLNKYKKGFTLIELLVVIAIIGMLASTVLVSLGTARSKGRDAKRIADLKNLELAIQLYSDSNNGAAPTALDKLTEGGKYIKQLPKDPNNGLDYGYVAYDKVTGVTPEKCLKYHLGAALENRNQVHEGDADFDSSAATVTKCASGSGLNGADTATDGTDIESKCGQVAGDNGVCYDLTN